MLSALLDAGVEFLLVGGLAMAAHGHARATKDMDLWVYCSNQNVEKVWRALAAFGAPMGSISREELADPMTVLQIGVPPGRIDLIMSLDGVEFHDAWARRIGCIINWRAIPTISRKDLIAVKWATGHPQDAVDVQTLEQSPYPDPPPASQQADPD